jgi:hypothetical protein
MKNVKNFIKEQVKSMSCELTITKTFDVNVNDIFDKMVIEYGDDVLPYIDGEMLSEFMETYTEKLMNDYIDEIIFFDLEVHVETKKVEISDRDYYVDIDDSELTMKEFIKNKNKNE